MQIITGKAASAAWSALSIAAARTCVPGRWNLVAAPHADLQRKCRLCRSPTQLLPQAPLLLLLLLRRRRHRSHCQAFIAPAGRGECGLCGGRRRRADGP